MYCFDKNSLKEEQTFLADKVEVPTKSLHNLTEKDNLVFTFDVHYKKDKAYVGLDVRRFSQEVCGYFAGVIKNRIPYISKYFCFREGPPIIEVYKNFTRRYSLRPYLILVDGHGIAHPRRMGLASWIGVKLAIPTIGCAKNSLLDYSFMPLKKRGKYSIIWNNGREVGAVLVTQDNVNPVFVSPGSKINIRDTMDIILKFSNKYRIPEPLRSADRIARNFASSSDLNDIETL